MLRQHKCGIIAEYVKLTDEYRLIPAHRPNSLAFSGGLLLKLALFWRGSDEDALAIAHAVSDAVPDGAATTARINRTVIVSTSLHDKAVSSLRPPHGRRHQDHPSSTQYDQPWRFKNTA